MTFYIIGQILCVIGYVTYYSSRFCKEKTRIVLVEGISKIITISSFAFLMNLPGVCANFITMARSFIVYFKEKYNRKFIPAYVGILLACIISGIFTYTNVFSTFCFVAALISTTATWFCKPQHLRIMGMFASIFTLIFQISIRNIAGIILELGSFSSCASSFIKEYIRQKRNDASHRNESAQAE